MGPAKPRALSRSAVAAAGNLRVDHMTAEVLGAFERAGVASILLKGPSTVRWLYPDAPRRYQDSDLLVSPVTVGVAEDVLRTLGFVPQVDLGKMPAWWREHSIHWVHPERPATLDVHRTLAGVGVDDGRVWEVLSRDTETLPVGGFPARVLSVPGRALHVALHAAQHGGVRDLTLALDAGEECWQAAARLANELGATAAFSAGLRLDPRGQALVDRLELRPSSPPLGATLRASRASPHALTIDRFAHASGLRERLAMVRYKLFPPPTFMRHWSPRARRGRLGLLAAYAQRVGWVARRAPGAFRSWLLARRPAQEDPPTRL